MFCYFLDFVDPDPAARLASDDSDKTAALLRSIPEIARAHIFTPASARDRYIDDGPPPMMAIQLYFLRLEMLERAAAANGALQELAAAQLASLAGARVSHQAMWTRPYPPPRPDPEPTAIRKSCAYMVHYPGEAEDLNAWLSFYLAGHPKIMSHFPGVREVEIYTRVDWIDALPWQRVSHFQRNKITFESAEALEQALHSPTREEMRADRAHFPPFSGGNAHYPMHCETVVGPLFRRSRD